MARKYRSITRISGDAYKLNQGDSNEELVVHLEGDRMLTLQDAYVEFARKMSFPEYFGKNMNALYDMLTDLSWVSFASFTCVIDSAELLLIDGKEGDKDALLDLLENTANFWATPVKVGEPWDRDAVTFKTILVECS